MAAPALTGQPSITANAITARFIDHDYALIDRDHINGYQVTDEVQIHRAMSHCSHSPLIKLVAKIIAIITFGKQCRPRC